MKNDTDELETDDALEEYMIQQISNKGLASREELIALGISSNADDDLLSRTIGMHMANPMPRFHSTLYDACQNNEVQDACIYIAKSLRKDKVIFNQHIGARLLKSLYDNIGLVNDIIKLEKQEKIAQEQINCYSNQDTYLATIVNQNIAYSHVKNIRDLGEREALKLLSFKVYKIEKEHGYNPGFNPNNCE